MIDRFDFWLVVFGLGIGSFVLRFAFLGLVGSRPLPVWLMRYLRYTPVAILPALVAPLVVWPAANGGETEPTRIAAALTTLVLGYFTKNMILSIFGGGAVLFGLAYMFPA